MSQLKLDMALDFYDRTLPFFLDDVTAEGINLRSLPVSSGPGQRHKRMLLDREFDVAEFSLSVYCMAKARGVPLTAIPVFPRRLFSQSQIYVHSDAGISVPHDMKGKRVGMVSYASNTLAVLARGELEHEYGVDPTGVDWVAGKNELLPCEPPGRLRVTRIEADRSRFEEMLAEGEIDGYLAPRIPKAFLEGDPRIARLFPDARAEEREYYRRTGIYPIRHLIVVKDEVLAANPWVARSLYDAFEAAREIAGRYFRDPNWSQLAWGYLEWEDEMRLAHSELWANGVAANYTDLERFLRYAFEQGLTDRKLAVDELFADVGE